MLKKEDAGDLLAATILICVGVPSALWFIAGPDTLGHEADWLQGHLNSLLLVFASLAAMLVVWIWTNRFSGPYTIEREDERGNWVAMATTARFREAQRMAHDSHRRITNVRGFVIFKGKAK